MQIFSELYQICENSQGSPGDGFPSVMGAPKFPSMPCWSLDGDEIPGGELRGFPALFLSKKIIKRLEREQLIPQTHG